MRRCKWGDNDGATHLKGLSSNPLNSSVYVHELGHFLLGNGVQTALPNSLKLLARNGMFNELLCDAFALAVTGRVFSQEPGIPACAANTRIVTRGQSYRAQRGYFDVNFGNRRIEACCNHIRKKSSVLELVLDAARTISENDLMREMTCNLANGFTSENDSQTIWSARHLTLSLLNTRWQPDLKSPMFTARRRWIE